MNETVPSNPIENVEGETASELIGDNISDGVQDSSLEQEELRQKKINFINWLQRSVSHLQGNCRKEIVSIDSLN
jgi:hypothetical protein